MWNSLTLYLMERTTKQAMDYEKLSGIESPLYCAFFEAWFCHDEEGSMLFTLSGNSQTEYGAICDLIGKISGKFVKIDGRITKIPKLTIWPAKHDYEEREVDQWKK